MVIKTHSPYGDTTIEIDKLLEFKSTPYDKWYLEFECKYVDFYGETKFTKMHVSEVIIDPEE